MWGRFLFMVMESCVVKSVFKGVIILVFVIVWFCLVIGKSVIVIVGVLFVWVNNWNNL